MNPRNEVVRYLEFIMTRHIGGALSDNAV